jgi:hypothetical protein
MMSLDGSQPEANYHPWLPAQAISVMNTKDCRKLRPKLISGTKSRSQKILVAKHLLSLYALMFQLQALALALLGMWRFEMMVAWWAQRAYTIMPI